MRLFFVQHVTFDRLRLPIPTTCSMDENGPRVRGWVNLLIYIHLVNSIRSYSPTIVKLPHLEMWKVVPGWNCSEQPQMQVWRRTYYGIWGTWNKRLHIINNTEIVHKKWHQCAQSTKLRSMLPYGGWLIWTWYLSLNWNALPALPASSGLTCMFKWAKFVKLAPKSRDPNHSIQMCTRKWTVPLLTGYLRYWHQTVRAMITIQSTRNRHDISIRPG